MERIEHRAPLRLARLFLAACLLPSLALAQEAGGPWFRGSQPASASSLYSAPEACGFSLRLRSPSSLVQAITGNAPLQAYLATSSAQSLFSAPTFLQFEAKRLELEKSLPPGLGWSSLLELSSGGLLICQAGGGDWVAVAEPNPSNPLVAFLAPMLGSEAEHAFDVAGATLRVSMSGGLLVVSTGEFAPDAAAARAYAAALHDPGSGVAAFVRTDLFRRLLGGRLTAGLDWTDSELSLKLEGDGAPGPVSPSSVNLVGFLPYESAAAVQWQAPWGAWAEAQLTDTLAALLGAAPDREEQLRRLRTAWSGAVALALETGRYQGKRFYPAGLLALGLSDAATAAPILRSLFVTLLKHEASEAKVGDVTIVYEGDRNGFSPAFAVVGSVALFSPDVAGIESALSRLASRPSLADRWTPAPDAQGALWLDLPALGKIVLERAKVVVEASEVYGEPDVRFGLTPLVQLLGSLGQARGTLRGQGSGWRAELVFRPGSGPAR